MAKYNYYYDDYSIKDDLNKCSRITKHVKRELTIYAGASLIGIAAAGILKEYGYGDLESSYPLMVLYLGCFLESIHYLKDAFASRKRLQDLSESIDEDNKDKVFDLLMKSEVETTKIESKADGEELHKKQINDFVVDGQVVVSQEYNLYYDENNTEVYSAAGVTSDIVSKKKTLK